jgi:septal ring factor EnvC (AmiA/AmiB activator)
MRRARRSSLLALIALTTVAAQPARPDKEAATRQQIEQADRQRSAEQAAEQAATARAAAAAEEERRLAAGRIAAAAKLRDAESATEQAADQMRHLTEEKQLAQEALNKRAATMEPLLPLIERLSLYPVETLLAVPGRAEDTLRGVLVLRGLADEVEQEAEALKRDQARLDAAIKALQAESPKLAAAQSRQQAEAAALDQQIAAAQSGQKQAQSDATAAARHAQDSAAKADSLRGALLELVAQRDAEAERARADAARAAQQKHADQAAAAEARLAATRSPVGAGALASAAQPHGQLTAPVAGTVVRGWGDATAGGPANGISYRAAPNARVVAVCGGRVAFSAPFRSYGLLLILDCGGGYHTVLAGFERLDVKVGQTVAAGEPVGVMPGWDPASTGERPTLYVELWREGKPVNPAPWLRASG